MTSNEKDTDMIECPEYNCPHEWTDVEALEAHLQWDHNRSESKSARFAYEALEDTERSESNE